MHNIIVKFNKKQCHNLAKITKANRFAPNKVVFIDKEKMRLYNLSIH